MNNIFTVTVNPAIDRMLYLGEYVPCITNRLSDSLDWLGGKGTHVSLDLKALGLPNTARDDVISAIEGLEAIDITGDNIDSFATPA